MAQLIDAIQALQRENKETLWGSMVKQTMIRKNPAFNESYYGYSTFSQAPGGGGQAEDRHARARREERHLHHHLPHRRRWSGGLIDMGPGMARVPPTLVAARRSRGAPRIRVSV